MSGLPGVPNQPGRRPVLPAATTEAAKQRRKPPNRLNQKASASEMKPTMSAYLTPRPERPPGTIRVTELDDFWAGAIERLGSGLAKLGRPPGRFRERPDQASATKVSPMVGNALKANKGGK